MFYKHYKMKIKGEKVHVVMAAMIGERGEMSVPDKQKQLPDGKKRDVFYNVIDITHEPFDDQRHHSYIKQCLEGELRDYAYIPLKDEIDVGIISDLEKKLKAALKRNKRERDYKMQQLKLIPGLEVRSDSGIII